MRASPPTKDVPSVPEPENAGSAGPDALPDLGVALAGLAVAVLLPVVALSFVLRDGSSLDATSLIDRWGSPIWLTLDWCLLLAASVHAVLAMWPHLADRGRGARALFGGIALVTATLFFGATLALLDLA